MFNIQKTIISHFVKQLKEAYQQSFGLLQPEYGNIVEWAGRLALENISNADTLYHDVNHTMMVALAGQEILKGKHLIEGNITPKDWLNYIIALLCHDIGYVKGICRSDKDDMFDSGIDRKMVYVSPKGTCASLAPYHVDRSKQFIIERFSGNLHVDAELVASYIEMTRFPIPKHDKYQATKNLHGLTRAADLIGQLGDPDHIRKIPALYYEFEESGANAKIGYKNPDDMRRDFAKFYWDEVSEFLSDAIKYLEVTQEGKEWISSMYAHVFAVENL